MSTRKASASQPALAGSKQKKNARKSSDSIKQAESSVAETYELRLYVAGQTARSLAAFANLKSICDEHLKGQYQIEVVDLLRNPQLAKGDQILALPTLVRKLPPPVKKIIGDLSNTERVLVGLNLRTL